jgi:hypothetical protein
MAAPVSKDRTDEYAADGILVVQVCRLRTVSRKIPQATALLTRRRGDPQLRPLTTGRTVSSNVPLLNDRPMQERLLRRSALSGLPPTAGGTPADRQQLLRK